MSIPKNIRQLKQVLNVFEDWPNSNSSVFWRYISSRKSIHRVVCRHYHTNSRYAQISTLYVKNWALRVAKDEYKLHVWNLQVTTKKETVSSYFLASGQTMVISTWWARFPAELMTMRTTGNSFSTDVLRVGIRVSADAELWRIRDATVSR